MADQNTEQGLEDVKLEKIYDYAIKMLEIKLERKHHFEVKTLYILQATAILITLFVGFQDNVSDKLTILQQANFIFFRNGFYLSMGVTLTALLLSLFDMIFGSFTDLLPPSQLRSHYETAGFPLYYKHQINAINSSIVSVDRILRTKITVFNVGIISFFIAILLLIGIGFMIN